MWVDSQLFPLYAKNNNYVDTVEFEGLFCRYVRRRFRCAMRKPVKCPSEAEVLVCWWGAERLDAISWEVQGRQMESFASVLCHWPYVLVLPLSQSWQLINSFEKIILDNLVNLCESFFSSLSPWIRFVRIIVVFWLLLGRNVAGA